MDERLQIAAEQAARRRRPGQRRWSRSGRRPARSSPRPTARAPAAYNIATYGQFAPGLDVQVASASLALLRAGLTPRTPSCRARPRSWSTASGSRTTTTTRPSGLGNIPLRTALANSCNTAFISQRGKLGQRRRSSTPPRRSAWASTTTSASRRTSATSCRPPVRDREGRRPDRPGQDPRLADGDGHGDRLDPGRARWCVPRAGHVASTSRGARRAPSRSAPAEAAALRAMLRGVVTGGSGSLPARRARPAGDRQDRHRRVRRRTASSAPTPG